MTEIRVLVKPPTAAGRLFSRYDDESRILIAESRFLVDDSNVVRPMPFGVDVDGSIVFDLDEARVLAVVDVHASRARWKRTAIPDLPSARTVGDLEFSIPTIRHKSFHLPLLVTCNSLATSVRVHLGERIPDRLVVLSDTCIALLSGDILSGFQFELDG